MFKDIIKDYSSRLAILRDFVAYVGPLLRKRAEDLEGKHGVVAGKDFKAMIAVLAGPDSELMEKLKTVKLSAKLTPAPIQPKKAPSTEPHERAATASIRSWDELSADEQVHYSLLAKKFQSSIQRLSLPKVHISHLYESSLISLVSTAEWFLARSLHAVFDKYPGRLDSEKAFTIQQLKALGSIAKVVEDATDARVEAILQKNVEDQISYFRKAFAKVDFSFIDHIFTDLVEIHARRNLFIHNGGIVNQRYLDRITTSGALGDLPSPGTRLNADEAYLDRAIDIFENVFVQVAVAIWKHVEPNDKERAFLIDLAIEQIQAGRYDTARAWSEITMLDTKQLRAVKLRAKFNYWQTYKWDGRFDEVRAEVELEDLSAAPTEYQLAKCALLDMFDEFFELLPKVVQEQRLTIEDLRTWPIFRAAREHHRYEEELTKLDGTSAFGTTPQLATQNDGKHSATKKKSMVKRRGATHKKRPHDILTPRIKRSRKAGSHKKSPRRRRG